MKSHAQAEAREKAMILLERNLATHTYFSHQLKPDLFEKMQIDAGDPFFDPIWMSSTYAVRVIDQYYQNLTANEYYYKEAAINARTPENEADAFEEEFIIEPFDEGWVNDFGEEEPDSDEFYVDDWDDLV